MPIDIIPVPLLADNYAYLIHCKETTVVVDPSEAAGVIEVLRAMGWGLDAVLNTHHHWDHVDGNTGLKREYACPVYGPRGDKERIRDLDFELGEEFGLGDLSFEVISIPGHTHHHIALWLKSAHAVFSGDTLFLMGCGRLFEGTPVQMWQSLSKLMKLPDNTKVYCGHEYTESNARFALSLDSHDPIVQRRFESVCERRQRGESTMPGTLGEEKQTNPFLRVQDPAFCQRIGLATTDPASAFAELRQRKDRF